MYLEQAGCLPSLPSLPSLLAGGTAAACACAKEVCHGFYTGCAVLACLSNNARQVELFYGRSCVMNKSLMLWTDVVLRRSASLTSEIPVITFSSWFCY